VSHLRTQSEPSHVWTSIAPSPALFCLFCSVIIGSLIISILADTVSDVTEIPQLSGVMTSFAWCDRLRQVFNCRLMDAPEDEIEAVVAPTTPEIVNNIVESFGLHLSFILLIQS
jgi:hypothetical protein